MSEQKVQTRIIKELDKLGFFVVKTIICNKKGIPDIIACSPTGHYVAIEVKYGYNKASKMQEYQIKQIQERGGFAMVCYNVESLITALTKEGII